MCGVLVVRAANMSESARALTDSMPNTIETTAQPLGFDEAFTLHHRAVFRTARALSGAADFFNNVTLAKLRFFQRYWVKNYRFPVARACA